MKIIAFSGGYGSGKSTAATTLDETFLNQPIFLVKFAQPLYNIQEYMYSTIARVHSRPADFVKDRKLLQWIGTEWGRGVDENLWVNVWKDAVEHILSVYDDAIILCDDCRFDNEAEAVRSLGGIVIKISRPDSSKHAEGGAGTANHASEGGISPALINYGIVNDSTLEEFKSKLKNVFVNTGGLADENC